MKIHILKSAASPGRSFRRGQVLEIADAIATDLIAHGIAEAVETEPAPEIETAAAPTYEKATTKRTKRKGR